jgi:hypothetical protein
MGEKKHCVSPPHRHRHVIPSGEGCTRDSGIVSPVSSSRYPNGVMCTMSSGTTRQSFSPQHNFLVSGSTFRPSIQKSCADAAVTAVTKSPKARSIFIARSPLVTVFKSPPIWNFMDLSGSIYCPVTLLLCRFCSIAY